MWNRNCNLIIKSIWHSNCIIGCAIIVWNFHIVEFQFCPEWKTLKTINSNIRIWVCECMRNLADGGNLTKLNSNKSFFIYSSMLYHFTNTICYIKNNFQKNYTIFNCIQFIHIFNNSWNRFKYAHEHIQNGQIKGIVLYWN